MRLPNYLGGERGGWPIKGLPFMAFRGREKNRVQHPGNIKSFFKKKRTLSDSKTTSNRGKTKDSRTYFPVKEKKGEDFDVLMGGALQVKETQS